MLLLNNMQKFHIFTFNTEYSIIKKKNLIVLQISTKHIFFMKVSFLELLKLR
jgi:hypothetical protein